MLAAEELFNGRYTLQDLARASASLASVRYDTSKRSYRFARLTSYRLIGSQPWLMGRRRAMGALFCPISYEPLAGCFFNGDDPLEFDATRAKTAYASC